MTTAGRHLQPGSEVVTIAGQCRASNELSQRVTDRPDVLRRSILTPCPDGIPADRLEIGAGDLSMLTVYNKMDLLPVAGPMPVPNGEELIVSAVTGEGLDRLVSEIIHQVSPVRV